MVGFGSPFLIRTGLYHINFRLTMQRHGLLRYDRAWLPACARDSPDG